MCSSLVLMGCIRGIQRTNWETVFGIPKLSSIIHYRTPDLFWDMIFFEKNVTDAFDALTRRLSSISEQNQLCSVNCESRSFRPSPS